MVTAFKVAKRPPRYVQGCTTCVVLPNLSVSATFPRNFRHILFIFSHHIRPATQLLSSICPIGPQRVKLAEHAWSFCAQADSDLSEPSTEGAVPTQVERLQLLHTPTFQNLFSNGECLTIAMLKRK
jgi:hypothetical protein